MPETEETTESNKRDVNWILVLWYIHLHVFSVYGALSLITAAQWLTVTFFVLLIVIAHIGIAVGAHRLWAHNTFKTSWHVKLLLIIAHTTAGVGSVRTFVLYHRMHHKYYGTDKDPYNHEKGFLYSHLISNLLMRRQDHEELVKSIDMRDVDQDILVWLQNKLYIVWYMIFAVLLPVNTPNEYWNESILVSIFVMGVLRLTISTHLAWLVNSSLIIWGLKNTDKYPPDDNLIFFVNRTFWPRYHYLMPWDWKTDEFGSYNSGLPTLTIKVFNELGFVTNLKTNEADDIEEALYNVATKRLTLEDALDQLKEKAEFDAIKVGFQYHH